MPSDIYCFIEFRKLDLLHHLHFFSKAASALHFSFPAKIRFKYILNHTKDNEDLAQINSHLPPISGGGRCQFKIVADGDSL